MTSKAYVEYDPAMLGLRIAVTRETPGFRSVLKWEPVSVSTVSEGDAAGPIDDAVWLRLPEDDLRAIYEALADHFGHNGHDTRALRKDYDAERARVDKLISHVIGGAR